MWRLLHISSSSAECCWPKVDGILLLNPSCQLTLVTHTCTLSSRPHLRRPKP